MRDISLMVACLRAAGGSPEVTESMVAFLEQLREQRPLTARLGEPLSFDFGVLACGEAKTCKARGIRSQLVFGGGLVASCAGANPLDYTVVSVVLAGCVAVYSEVNLALLLEMYGAMAPMTLMCQLDAEVRVRNDGPESRLLLGLGTHIQWS